MRVAMRKWIISLVLLSSVVAMAEETKSTSLFDWSVNTTLTSNYIWRGLYVGGPSLQLDATVSYAGVYANMWWNVGASDWTFTGFNPEVDITIGFSRWGLNINYLYCFYFDQYPDGSPSKFFDFKNHPRGGGGTTGEWRVSYVHKIPIAKNYDGQVSGLVAFRTFGRDGYYAEVKGENGEVKTELKRAYSTYIELGYDQQLSNNWTLAARFGFTPAKSLYTAYQGDFAVTLVGLKLQKEWFVKDDEAVIQTFVNVMLQPWQLTKSNLIRPITEADSQKLNMAVGCSLHIGK